MADDVAMVERIYEHAALPMTTAARGQLDAYMKVSPRECAQSLKGLNPSGYFVRSMSHVPEFHHGWALG